MQPPVTTQLAMALQARLQAITRANGFHTDLGNSVWRGFWSRAIEAQERVPLLAIQPDTEDVSDTRSDKARLSITRRLIVVADGLPSGTDPYAAEDTLEAALADVRHALLGTPGDDLQRIGVKDAITLGTAEYALAADSRYALAGLPVTLTCIEHYRED